MTDREQYNWLIVLACLLPLPFLPALLRFCAVVVLAAAFLVLNRPWALKLRGEDQAINSTRWLLFAALMLLMPSLVVLFVYGVVPPAYLPVEYLRNVIGRFRSGNLPAVVMGAIIFGGALCLYTALYFVIADGSARAACRSRSKRVPVVVATLVWVVFAASAATPIYVRFGDGAPSNSYRQAKPRVVNLAGLLMP